MVALAPRISAHQNLHTLRASLCEQYGKMQRAYAATHQHYFKGICKGLHQAVKEIDALLDDLELGDLSKETDRLDHLENHGRLNGSNPDQGTDGAKTPKVGAWRNVAKGAVVLGILVAWCLLQMRAQ